MALTNDSRYKKNFYNPHPTIVKRSKKEVDSYRDSKEILVEGVDVPHPLLPQSTGIPQGAENLSKASKSTIHADKNTEWDFSDSESDRDVIDTLVKEMVKPLIERLRNKNYRIYCNSILYILFHTTHEFVESLLHKFKTLHKVQTKMQTEVQTCKESFEDFGDYMDSLLEDMVTPLVKLKNKKGRISIDSYWTI
jgi:hypothetical protein